MLRCLVRGCGRSSAWRSHGQIKRSLTGSLNILQRCVASSPHSTLGCTVQLFLPLGSYIYTPIRLSTMSREDDPRLGQILITRSDFEAQKHRPERCVALIQVPCDEGVARNGGRVGAAEGPKVTMDLLHRFGCLHNRERNIDLAAAGVQLVDYGTTSGKNLELVHTELRGLVLSSLQSGLIPICLGGGNDQSWANGAGWLDYWQAKQPGQKLSNKFCVINVDAHLDVRPLLKSEGSEGLAHSGSPFRQLVEYAKDKFNLHLIEYASQGQQCSSAHVDYVNTNNGEIVWLSDIKRRASRTATDSLPVDQQFSGMLRACQMDGCRVFFSFDLDSIRAADCPGVSCPSPVGLTSEEAIEMCYVAGQSPIVDLMDISEFNPRVESSQTSRLVANMVYSFVLGYSQRVR
ncbi:unnamed protein product [Calicophoron daubneyi]|uniref:Arginase n=1 Tax=Calicophoron daubneyi TaxID=300641 RepID=A0AAV2TYL8_CALDB